MSSEGNANAPSIDIYFCGSVSGAKGDAELYGRLMKKLEEFGTVLSERPDKDAKEAKDQAEEEEIHDRSIRLLAQADIVVAEVTTPSLGVGYEIGRAVSMGKRLLCLYRNPSGSGAKDGDGGGGNQLSAMIRGLHNDEDMIVTDYKEDEAEDIFKDFFAGFDPEDEAYDDEEDDEGEEDEDEDGEGEGEDGEDDGGDDED